MQLSLDLPKYKWKQIYECLEPSRDECEPVNLFCTAIEMSNFEKEPSLNEKIFSFLVSTGQFPYSLDASTEVKNHKGGPQLISEINYKYHMTFKDARIMYRKYIENNFKMIRIDSKDGIKRIQRNVEESKVTKEDLEDLKIDKSKPIKIIKEKSK